MLAISSCLLLLFLNSFECKKYYNEHDLYKTVPENEMQLTFLKSMKDLVKVDFWRPPTKISFPTEFISDKTNGKDFLDAASRLKLNVTKIEDNVASLLETHRTFMKYNTDAKIMEFDQFYEPDDINRFLADIVENYPDKVKYLNIGKTFLGRNISVIVVNKNIEGPAVIVEAGMHGNEWITISFALYLIHEIVIHELTEKDNQILAQSYRWYIIPVANPDGFMYTHVEDRLWRRNRNTNPVDLNRNFDIMHGKHESSFHLRSPYFCGNSPFSEPETQAMKRFIEDISRNLMFYFSIHSYGQQIILPYIGQLSNREKMLKIARHATEKMKIFYNMVYKSGNTEEMTGAKMSGSSANWVKSKFETEYVFTFNLRDNGSYGYALPPDQIEKACKEAFEGIKYILLSERPRHLQRILRNTNISSESVETPFNSILICFTPFIVIVYFQ